MVHYDSCLSTVFELKELDIYIYYTLIPDFNSTLVLRLFEELYCLVIYDDISQLMGFRIPVGCCRGYILAKEMSGLMYI